MNAFLIGKIGSLMAGGGIAWAAYSGTRDVDLNGVVLESVFRNILMQTGPLEVCGAGILVWILGKWRASVSIT